LGGIVVDKDRIQGPVKEGAGKVEEAWGRATNDPDVEAKGEGKQAEGKIQEGWGHAKDDVRDAVHDATHDDQDEH
jgi:uncharacterized protein YjbJ (UPF0337 family)